MTTPARNRQRAERKGHYAEWAAAALLSLKGYRLLKHRYKSPAGEIDLIAIKGGTVIFLEVKARKTIDTAIEAVTPRTQKRICAAASMFFSRLAHFAQAGVRYDIIAIAGWRHKHIRGAWHDLSLIHI